MTGALIGVALFALGVGLVAGFTWGWHACPPKLEISLDVTPDVVRDLDQQLVMRWLDARGLVWQPKGMADIAARAKKDAG